LGRLHPLKGLDLLISAWAEIKGSIAPKALVQGLNRADGAGSKVTNEFLSWQLVIAGPDEQDTLKNLREQVKRLELEKSVTFCGPLYGEEKRRVLQSADLFALPTRSENFGIAVAEALASGVPVITTKGAPWSELLGNSDSSFVHYCDSALVEKPEDGGQRPEALPTNELLPDSSFILQPSAFAAFGRCGWWVEIGVEPLAEALREAMSLTDEARRVMGANGRRLVEAKYRWVAVAERMAGVYREIIAATQWPQ